VPENRYVTRWRKLVLGLVLALIALELVYVVGINVLLRTGQLVRWLNASENLHVEVRSGWSIWPGTLHADEVLVRFEDRNIQLLAVVEHAVVDVQLRKLITRTLHLSGVRGDGTRYLMRHKVSRAAGSQRRLARYPEIPGFSDPPLITEPPTPPLSDADYDLWTVELADTDVQVSEVWLQEYRFRGSGRARGGFRLQPQREARTERCTLELNGTLESGTQVVLRRLRGSIEARLDRHDPRQVEGREIFAKLSLHSDLRGELSNLNATRLYAKPGWPRLERGSGPIEIQTDFEHGVWREGSTIRYRTDGLTVNKHKLSAVMPAQVTARVVKGGRHARMRLTFASPRVAIAHGGVPETIEAPYASEVHVVLGATLDPTRPLHWTSLSSDLHAVLPTARWLDHALGGTGRLGGGRADAEVHAEWSAKAPGSARLQGALQNIALNIGQHPIELSGRLDAEADYDFANERGKFDALALSLPEFRVAGSALPGGLQVQGRRLHFQGLPPERSEARFELTSQDISPLLPLFIPSGLERALAKAFVDLGTTRALLELDRTPEAWELRLLEARSGDVEAFGRLRKELGKGAPRACGRWYVQTGGALRVGVVVAGGETSVKPLVSPSWWRERPVNPHCAPAS
jgi:hypothetical protein